MIGRHFIEITGDRDQFAHVMRASYPSNERVTRFPLDVDEAQTHAESLNHNDADDIRQYGEVQN